MKVHTTRQSAHRYLQFHFVLLIIQKYKNGDGKINQLIFPSPFYKFYLWGFCTPTFDVEPDFLHTKMLPGMSRATQKFYIFSIVYLTGRTPILKGFSYFLFSVSRPIKKSGADDAHKYFAIKQSLSDLLAQHYPHNSQRATEFR